MHRQQARQASSSRDEVQRKLAAVTQAWHQILPLQAQHERLTSTVPHLTCAAATATSITTTSASTPTTTTITKAGISHLVLNRVLQHSQVTPHARSHTHAHTQAQTTTPKSHCTQTACYRHNPCNQRAATSHATCCDVLRLAQCMIKARAATITGSGAAARACLHDRATPLQIKGSQACTRTGAGTGVLLLGMSSSACLTSHNTTTSQQPLSMRLCCHWQQPARQASTVTAPATAPAAVDTPPLDSRSYNPACPAEIKGMQAQ